MTPEEEAIAVRDTRCCKIVPLSNGDLALFDSNGNLVTVADVRPMSFGGFGLGGLINAIELAVNKTASNASERFHIPVKGQKRPGEYWETHQRTQTPQTPQTHQRTQTVGQPKYQAPTAVNFPRAQVVGSAAEMGFVKVNKVKSE